MRTFIAITLLGIIATFGSASADSNADSGYAIARRAHDLSTGYGSYAADGTMILIAANGAQSVRRFHFASLEVAGGALSKLTFVSPGDIRGTALLTHMRSGRADSQWIYLSEARRVKRISSSSRSGSFLGSEFGYDDLIDQGLDKYSYRLMGSQGCCDLVERKPRTPSGYSRQLVYFNKASGLVSRVEYFNRRNTKYKTLTASGYNHKGGVWKPSSLRMLNHLTGKSTILRWSNMTFGVRLNISDFSPNTLGRFN